MCACRLGSNGTPLSGQEAAPRLLARMRLCVARWTADQGGSVPAELHRLFREAQAADRDWDKPHFYYARYECAGAWVQARNLWR